MVHSTTETNHAANLYDEVLNGKRVKADRRLILDVMRSGSDPKRGDRPDAASRCKPPAQVFIQRRLVMPVFSRVSQFMAKSTTTRKP